jgi:hypothetical protein
MDVNAYKYPDLMRIEVLREIAAQMAEQTQLIRENLYMQAEWIACLKQAERTAPPPANEPQPFPYPEAKPAAPDAVKIAERIASVFHRW